MPPVHLAFHELGDTKMAATTFSDTYLKSCRRLRSPSANSGHAGI
jgi:hypothetical protein